MIPRMPHKSRSLHINIKLWAANASSHCKHRLQLPMAALCLSWNVGHYLRWALIATLVAVSGNLAASEDGAFWHAACMLPSCYSWKKWCHNTLLQVPFWSIWCLKDLKRCLPNFATWRPSKIVPSCSINFSHTLISISSTSLLCKASCECYCSIGSLGPRIKGRCECHLPVDQAKDPNQDKGNCKACCQPVPCQPTLKFERELWRGSCDYVIIIIYTPPKFNIAPEKLPSP